MCSCARVAEVTLVLKDLKDFSRGSCLAADIEATLPDSNALNWTADRELMESASWTALVNTLRATYDLG